MKRSLRIFALAALGFVCCGGLAACNGGGDSTKKDIKAPEVKQEETLNVKVGLITLHDESSTYDKNFIDAMKDSAKRLGFEDKLVIKSNVPETNEAYEAAKELVQQNGCQIIFADSFGHEASMIKAAKEFPNVQFCHATGTRSQTANETQDGSLPNYHNAFANIYEGRYLAGIVAGQRLASMLDADKTLKPVVGYVGAWQYAEVKSGYTSWFLGVKSVVPNVTMKVQFTSSWYDENAEKNAAENLISKGCVLVSQHADSWGAPKACEAAGVPNVSYNGSTGSQCPETYLVSSRINWSPYYEMAIRAVAKGEAFATDWAGSVADGSVELIEYGQNIAPGTNALVLKATYELATGARRVFDCANFTVKNAKANDTYGNITCDANGHLTAYNADVKDIIGDDGQSTYAGDTNVVTTDEATGITYFSESTFRSAPYFDLEIDGIELLNSGFGA